MLNIVLRFFKKNQTDTILIFFLLLLAYNAWHMLSRLTMRSDGFVYMLHYTQEAFLSRSFFYTGFENSAMIFGFIFPRIFGAHISLYYWTVLIFMIAIDVLLYIAMKHITKKSFIAFVTSLIFAVNYFGLYDMVSTHCYCFFLERVIPVVFLIPSFLFLHLFLEKKIKKYLIASSVFYFFGVGLGHFTILFTPLFLFYPIFWYLSKEKKIKRKTLGVVFGFLYLLQSGFFVLIQQINESGLGPKKWTFIEFLSNPEKFMYFKKIGLQFVYWTQYPFVLKEYGVSLQTIIDVRKAGSFIPYILVTYLIAAVVIFIRLPKQRPMLLTTIFGAVVIFYLNAYFNQYDMLNFSGSSRYLYFPSFLLSIFWSYFLWAVFFQKRNFFTVLGIGAVVLYYFANVLLIQDHLRAEIVWNRSTRAIIDHVNATRKQVSKNTLIVVSYPEFASQEATFFTEQLGKGEVRYMSEKNFSDTDTWVNQASISAYVLKLTYERECMCVKEARIK